ncbi:MAG: aldehyde dehydrogenase family protein, partial [Planctomycetota bacterium]|nr:aldehyde dehydrogenase family protein [Planctomycetota bacterium]
AVFGPNNFPFAFGSVSGGDFAAAIAAGNPVIGKANSSHPGTTRIFAEQALKAAELAGVPKAIVQLIYRTSHTDGEKLVSDPRLGASGYTGSRGAGLKLKSAADAAGKPIYLELSSVNPVILLPGVLSERGESLVDEFVGSSLMGTGQFCTNPGIVFVPNNHDGKAFTQAVKKQFDSTAAGTLLSEGTEKALSESIAFLEQNGANRLTTGDTSDPGKFSCANALLSASIEDFLEKPQALQTEAFGNAALFVSYTHVEQLVGAISALEGNLTGCIYSDSQGSDNSAYNQIASLLSQKVGRLLNDKMPTGVAVSSAMNHGGPFPATGHPGHSAVGIPGTIRRFAMLQCYDGVRPERLPELLRDASPSENTWRLIDGHWSTGEVVTAG